MIYAITPQDMWEVRLDMSLDAWRGDIIRCRFELNEETMTVSEQWCRSPTENHDFDGVALKDVPRWCRCMADKMRPKIVAQYFQPLIDEREAEELANKLS